MENIFGKYNSICDDIFWQNEIRTNRNSLHTLIILAVGILILSASSILGLFNLALPYANWIFLFMSLVILFVCFTILAYSYETKWCKYVIFFCFFLICGIAFFLYPLNALFLLYGPLMISIKYYNKKFTRFVAVVTFLVFTVTVIANYLLDEQSLIFNNFHYVTGVFIWDSFKNTVFYFYIPKVLIFLLTTEIALRISGSGVKIITLEAQALAAANEMQSAVSTAASIQQNIMPNPTFVSSNGRFRIFAKWKPARDVGGDFFDYFYVSENEMVFMIADVSDKGLPAAMFVMQVQSALCFALKEEYDLKEAVQQVNKHLCQDNASNMFVTLWIAKLDLRTGILEYVNAGHLPPLLKDKNGNVRYIENEPNTFIGMLDNIDIQSHNLVLKEGERLFLYTDGVTDARNKNDEEFGKDRLYDIVAKSSQCCKDVYDAVFDFIGDAIQFDDVTMMEICLQEESDFLYADMTVGANNKNVTEVIDTTNKMLIEKDCPEDIRRNIDVVIDEIFSNISNYAYVENEEGSIYVKIAVSYNYARIYFADKGKSFDPLNQKGPVFVDTKMRLEEGGLGIYFVKKMMDEVSYDRKEIDGEEYNIITVIKKW